MKKSAIALVLIAGAASSTALTFIREGLRAMDLADLASAERHASAAQFQSVITHWAERYTELKDEIERLTEELEDKGWTIDGYIEHCAYLTDLEHRASCSLGRIFALAADKSRTKAELLLLIAGERKRADDRNAGRWVSTSTEVANPDRVTVE